MNAESYWLRQTATKTAAQQVAHIRAIVWWLAIPKGDVAVYMWCKKKVVNNLIYRTKYG